VLQAGQQLYPRRRKFADVSATLLPDVRLDIGGNVFSTPSDAAKSLTMQPTNGWLFFLVDKEPRRALTDVRRDYRESFLDELDEEDGDDDAGDEEEV
jgi:hypothetical protein